MNETQFREKVKRIIVKAGVKQTSLVAGFRTEVHVPDALWSIPSTLLNNGGRVVWVEYKGPSTKLRLGQQMFIEGVNRGCRVKHNAFVLRAVDPCGWVLSTFRHDYSSEIVLCEGLLDEESLLLMIRNHMGDE